jgi:GH24 family phage-related lysozyme (muramidase)
MIMCRGTKLEGENRAEMRELVQLIEDKDYEGIADAVERSKRLSETRGFDDLVRRREAEADLIFNSI